MKNWFVLALLAFFITPVFASGSCRSHHCDDETAPAPATTVIVKKDSVPVGAIVAGVITIGAVIYCGHRRWVKNDPCFGEPLKKTSEADDRITPANVKDEKPYGVRLYQ